jgi:hypothetical protein
LIKLVIIIFHFNDCSGITYKNDKNTNINDNNNAIKNAKPYVRVIHKKVREGNHFVSPVLSTGT